jgi:hypothetical protein
VGRLALLLGLLESGDSLAEDLALHVAPFLARLAAPAAGGDVPGGGGSHADHEGGEEGEAAVDPQLVLRQALEAEAAERLPWVVRLVQAEARRRTAFASAAQLAKTAAACCYACTVRGVCAACVTRLCAGSGRGDVLVEQHPSSPCPSSC